MIGELSGYEFKNLRNGRRTDAVSPASQRRARGTKRSSEPRLLCAFSRRQSGTPILRCDDPPEEVGKPGAKPPLNISPGIKGTCTWLDPFRCVFQPAEPLPLGASYSLSLRRDLKNSDGALFAPEWTATLTTPAPTLLRVESKEWFEKPDAPPNNPLQLTFNADVNPKELERTSHFEGGGLIFQKFSFSPVFTREAA